jgi:hypothetical protein
MNVGMTANLALHLGFLAFVGLKATVSVLL